MVRMLAIAITFAFLVALHPAKQVHAQQEPLDQMRSQAAEMFREGEYSEALPVLREILRHSPSDRTALRYMQIYNMELKEPLCREAAAAFFDRDYRTAASKWQEILELDPSDSSVRNLINEAMLLSNRNALVMLYVSAERMTDAGQYQDAARELEKILEIDPSERKAKRMLDSIRTSIEDSTISSLYTTASDLRARGEYDLAVDALNQILKLDPTQKLASRMIEETIKSKQHDAYQRAARLYSNGRYVESRDQFRKLMETVSPDPETEKEAQRLSEVMKILPDASRGGEEWKAIRVAMENYISPKGSPELAAVAARYAMEASPGNPASSAVHEFIENRFGKLKIGFPEAPGSLGILELYLLDALNNIYEGRYARAVQQCSIVLTVDENNPLALKRLGSAFYLMGDRTRAKAAWDKAIRLEPGDQELKDFISMLSEQ